MPIDPINLCHNVHSCFAGGCFVAIFQIEGEMLLEFNTIKIKWKCCDLGLFQDVIEFVCELGTGICKGNPGDIFFDNHMANITPKYFGCCNQVRLYFNLNVI